MSDTPRDDADDADDELAPSAAASAPPEADPEPAADRLDELLADPPLGEYNQGRLGGYAAGARSRRLLALVGVVAVIVIIAGGYALITHFQNRKPIPIHAAPLPEGTDVRGRSRVMTWSSGQARLALTREPPGADTIVLPDRVIGLADGCDAAQVKVEVEDGRTTMVKVLYGEVVQGPRQE